MTPTSQRFSIPRRDRTLPTLLLAAWLTCMAVYGLAFRSCTGSHRHQAPDNVSGDMIGPHVRHLLFVHAHNACTPRSVETYPPDLFTLQQKQQGAIVIHILVAVWLFAALAVVCNDYFLASMEVLCDALHLKPDVAGATFMAGSSSAPELLTSIIGVFFAESDVGVSTIVGSAVFNILMIVSMCGLLSTRLVCLSWWPLFRDCSFYCISVIALIVVIYDGFVSWFESIVLVGLYILYIVMMFFNDRLDNAISSRFPSLGTGAAYRLNGKTDVIDEERAVLLSHSGESQRGYAGIDLHLVSVTVPADSGPESPWQVPQGLLRRIIWLFMLPWSAAFFITVPDCRRPGVWKRLFPLTLICSVVWISVISYLMVWMVCATGDALGIPDTVMGLTLLAAGTSVPDCMAAVFVSKGGLGDMAVSNSIGSNVFNILICLGLPWLISTVIVYPGSSIIINSSGLTYSSITLFSTIVFLFVIVYYNKSTKFPAWRDLLDCLLGCHDAVLPVRDKRFWPAEPAAVPQDSLVEATCAFAPTFLLRQF